jgi:hypothetical protein
VEDVSVSRDQFPLAIVDVSERAEAINLQFVHESSESNGSERRESLMGRRFRGDVTKRSITKIGFPSLWLPTLQGLPPCDEIYVVAFCFRRIMHVAQS